MFQVPACKIPIFRRSKSLVLFRNGNRRMLGLYEAEKFGVLYYFLKRAKLNGQEKRKDFLAYNAILLA